MYAQLHLLLYMYDHRGLHWSIADLDIVLYEYEPLIGVANSASDVL